MTENYQHCIFVCSNYTSRTRTGLHFLYNDSNFENVVEMAKKYSSKKGVAFYFVNTNEFTIESVKAKDAFFKTINILEGTNRDNVVEFDNAINNQITVFDVALLLLCRKSLMVKDLKTILFYVYCLYAEENDKFPFNEKLFFDISGEIGFKSINAEFDALNQNSYLECTRSDVIMSKFFNCEGGVELMNAVLRIFYKIEKNDINKLYDKIEFYFNKCKKIYRLEKRESRYAFTLSKKAINKLKININV